MNWFVNDKGHHENWASKVSVSSTKYFRKFALLNTKKRQYLTFDNTLQENPEDFSDYYSNLEMNKHHIPEHSLASHGRNQLTKKFLMLIIRVANEGTQAHVFFGRDTKKVLKFKHDHIYASQDVMTQFADLSPSEAETFTLDQKFLIQSATISQGDQEIHLKTQMKQAPGSKKNA